MNGSYINMKLNNKKIIRAVTVSQSLSFCRELMIKMRELGYEMVAVTSPGPELDELRDNDGFHCVAVPMERHISLARDLKSLFQMICVFREERPQVVHSMTPKAGLICMMAGWITGVPKRVHTFTGLVWPTATGVKRRILMFTDWLTCACATHIIPEGKGVMNDLQTHITKKNMRVLGYGNVRGVDMKFWCRENADKEKLTQIKDSSLFTFLFVGRIVKDKGINELVEAFMQVRKNTKARLILVGSFEDDLDPINDFTRNQIFTCDDIIYAGPQYGKDLLAYYAASDCFVFPSYREGFPNTVLEAGAMGLPSIVTDINGSREIIENGKNGLIIQSKSTDELTNAMAQMIKNREMREKMSKEARPMIESRFEQSFVRKCMIDFYESIM